MASQLAVAEDIFVHDVYNIVALAIIGPLDLWYLWQATDVSKMGTAQLGEGHVDLAMTVLYIFLVYLLIDVVWIYMVPSCVQAKPSVIICHHVCTLVLVAIPILDNRWCWHGMIDLISEVNTLFLTIRRNLKLDGPSYKLVNFLFYATWIASRVFLFPALAIFFVDEYLLLSKELGSPVNIYIVGPVLQSLLVAFSYYWTYLMILKVAIPTPKSKKTIDGGRPDDRKIK